MPNKKISIKVIPFKNRGGSISYRVSGSVLGMRVQKNYSNLEEAKKFEVQVLQAANQGESKRQAITSFGSDDELHVAEFAHKRLKGFSESADLLQAVEYFIKHHRKTTAITPLDAVLAFSEARRRRGNREKSIEVTQSVLHAFAVGCGVRSVSELAKDHLEQWALSPTVSLRTRRDRRDALYNWMEFLVKGGYAVSNLAALIDRPKVTHGTPGILSVAQSQALLDAAIEDVGGYRQGRGSMLPYFAICLLSGIRPDEVKRLRENWENVIFGNNLIWGFMAKTNRQRSVAMPLNLRVILEWSQEQGHEPGFFSTRVFKRVRRAAGVEKIWCNDVMRHTYASHHYAVHHDLGYLTKNMGNSEAVLLQSYVNQTVLREQGEAFERLVPTALRARFEAALKKQAGG